MGKWGIKLLLLAAGAGLIGGCGKSDADIEKSHADEDYKKIAKFVNEAYFVFDNPKMAAGQMGRDERALTMRFIDIARRGKDVEKTITDVSDSFDYMEPPLQDSSSDPSPRIRRYDYIRDVAALNDQADALAERASSLVAKAGKAFQDRHNDALAPCHALAGQRNMEPALRSDSVTPMVEKSFRPTNFPEQIVLETQDKLHKYRLERDDILFYLETYGFEPAVNYRSSVEDFEATINDLEKTAKTFTESMAPVIDAMKARYASFRHKEIVMKLNIDGCAGVLDAMEARRGAFIDLPQAKP